MGASKHMFQLVDDQGDDNVEKILLDFVASIAPTLKFVLTSSLINNLEKLLRTAAPTNDEDVREIVISVCEVDKEYEKHQFDQTEDRKSKLKRIYPAVGVYASAAHIRRFSSSLIIMKVPSFINLDFYKTHHET